MHRWNGHLAVQRRQSNVASINHVLLYSPREDVVPRRFVCLLMDPKGGRASIGHDTWWDMKRRGDWIGKEELQRCGPWKIIY